MTDQTAIVKQHDTSIIEQVLMSGDLARLNPEQRMQYYMRTCDSLGLNPLTRPFEYITLNGKLTLYARKDAAEQLRKLNGISIEKPDIRFEDDWIIVTVAAHDAQGRTDSDVGVVSKKDMRGDFGNALMKAVTKAKRRVTLSICGLGMLDETEIDTIPDARPVIVTTQGEIVQPETPAQPKKQTAPKENGGHFNPVQFLIDNGISENSFAALAILNSKITPADVKTSADKLLPFGKLYRAWKDSGVATDQALEYARDNVAFE